MCFEKNLTPSYTQELRVTSSSSKARDMVLRKLSSVSAAVKAVSDALLSSEARTAAAVVASERSLAAGLSRLEERHCAALAERVGAAEVAIRRSLRRRPNRAETERAGPCRSTNFSRASETGAPESPRRSRPDPAQHLRCTRRGRLREAGGRYSVFCSTATPGCAQRRAEPARGAPARWPRRLPGVLVWDLQADGRHDGPQRRKAEDWMYRDSSRVACQHRSSIRIPLQQHTYSFYSP